MAFPHVALEAFDQRIVSTGKLDRLIANMDARIDQHSAGMQSASSIRFPCLGFTRIVDESQNGFGGPKIEPYRVSLHLKVLGHKCLIRK